MIMITISYNVLQKCLILKNIKKISRKIRHVAIRSCFHTLDFYKVWRLFRDKLWKIWFDINYLPCLQCGDKYQILVDHWMYQLYVSSERKLSRKNVKFHENLFLIEQTFSRNFAFFLRKWILRKATKTMQNFVKNQNQLCNDFAINCKIFELLCFVKTCETKICEVSIKMHNF